MIEVIEPGALTSVQDVDGRPGWRHIGVPVGGAADPWSARLANLLVGNPANAALLEMTLTGPILRFHGTTVAAVTGGLTATLDGMPMPPNAARSVRAGSLLRVESGDGARGYLAVAGGIGVEKVLGSAATDLRTGFGGHEGRALRAGDRLSFNPGGRRLLRWTGGLTLGPIRIVDGPHPGAPLVGTWKVSAQADRAGIRLDGPTLVGGEVASMGLPLGAIQVPPNGRPIVMLADRPVTGGYRVPALVIRADIGRVAQLRTGDEVTFASVSLDAARSALRRADEELAALEVLDAPADDELGWAGSHD